MRLEDLHRSDQASAVQIELARQVRSERQIRNQKSIGTPFAYSTSLMIVACRSDLLPAPVLVESPMATTRRMKAAKARA